jgi:hypothetical protein
LAEDSNEQEPLIVPVARADAWMPEDIGVLTAPRRRFNGGKSALCQIPVILRVAARPKKGQSARIIALN